MKKIFSFVLMLAATLTLSAADYCSVSIKSVQEHDATVTMRLVAGTLYEFSITTADNIVSFNAAGSNFYAEVNGVGGYHLSEHLTQTGNTLSVQFESNVKPKIYANALFIVLDGIGENQFNIPMDADWNTCGDAKTDPELALNATETTLDANASETFQITATQKGDGAISYESSNAGIASVTNTGLVTAVGRGTAVISVKTAETDTYALSMKTLTVTVTGDVNWEAIEWLAGGNEKYKVVTEPEIPNNFGGKHIEGDNLWIGFPSAVWGDNSGIEHSAVGAGVSFPLSQFPNEFNDFNFICDGVTYKITLYYADGTKTTAIERVYNNETRTCKVVEGGKIVIVKDGVRFNVLGAKL
ncbi:MAG: Ig-like domain-containing protein [Paludibacteraceae bacterium]|nr:Ig-like domain-containing protein [Paludibacteraceae bacterium]